MKPVSAHLTAGTSADPTKYNAAVDVTVTRNPEHVYPDLSATQRDAVLSAVIAAVRDTLTGYSCPASITSEETVSA